MQDFPVYRYKTTTMQRIQQLSIRGYHWYTSGKVPHNKAQKLVDKFDELYGIGCNENQRSYRRSKGIANAKLLLYPIKDSKTFYWWLLVTDGTGAVHKKEKLSEVVGASDRLQWADEYELVWMTREGKKDLVITWRMTKKNITAWHFRIKASVRKRSTEDFRQALWSLQRAPGFSEVRNQVKALRRQIKKEWGRSKRKSEEMPALSPIIPYVRAADTEALPLMKVVQRMTKGLRPFPRKVIQKSVNL